jgi:hypothetical protein
MLVLVANPSRNLHCMTVSRHHTSLQVIRGHGSNMQLIAAPGTHNMETHLNTVNRNKGASLAAVSPYTIKNLDDAIAHLEAAIDADFMKSVFGPLYWYGRVLQVGSTPGIMHTQSCRLQRLLDRIANTARRSDASTNRTR